MSLTPVGEHAGRQNNVPAGLYPVSPTPKYLEQDYAQLARATDRLLTPITVTSPDSTLQYANRVAAKFFETDPVALVARGSLGVEYSQ
jgi:hypothetical protein